MKSRVPYINGEHLQIDDPNEEPYHLANRVLIWAGDFGVAVVMLEAMSSDYVTGKSLAKPQYAYRMARMTAAAANILRRVPVEAWLSWHKIVDDENDDRVPRLYGPAE